jgi:two-component system, chemotaxis family, chemotaxis protein CheY
MTIHAGMRILIADDAPVERAILRRLVVREGHEVAGEACDSDELLELASGHLPDLVVLDGRFPPVGGLHALALLRALPSPPAVIVIAALGERAFLETAVRSGAQGGVLRPLSAADFAETLRHLARTT